MADDYVRFCKNCGLVFRPDERIYNNSNEICPKCGYKLIPDSEDYKDE